MDLPSVAAVAKMIDHSLLRPELTLAEVRQGCALAARHHVASVCVRPADVATAVEQLLDTDVLVGTVVAFPHGSSSTPVKVAETHAAVADGASEIDMVLNIGRLRSRDDTAVEGDIRAVVEAASGAVVKVIFENAYLSDEEKRRACVLSEAAGAHYVKTSTGFAPGGATIEDVHMRDAVSPKTKVKAAGGVRTLGVLLAMRQAGATRFGATATEQILTDLATRLERQPVKLTPNTRFRSGVLIELR